MKGVKPCDDPTFGHTCCCNCQNHIRDFHHCTTKRGRKPGTCVCSEQKGWICAPEGLTGPVYSGWKEHGLCEMHRPLPTEALPMSTETPTQEPK